MKLAFVTPWYGEFAGGAEVIVREAAENLANHGIDVEVLTTCVRTPFHRWWTNELTPGEYFIDGVRVRRFRVNEDTEDTYHEINYKLIHKMPVNREDELKYLKGSISSDSMVSFIRDHKNEYVFILTPYLYGLVYWAYQAAPDRCILSPCLHDEPQGYFSTTKELMSCKKVLFYSEEEKSLAKNIFALDERRLEIIGGGVKSHDNFYAKKFLDKYDIKFNYLLYVGRKDRGKNVDLLIKYFDCYKRQSNDDLKLLFIGGGDASLVPASKDFVDLGFVEEDDKYNAYAGALATCLLSENESFSLVIMESWLATTPVIVSDNCPVTKGHCIRSNGGLFVDNEEEFAAAVDYLKSHPEAASKMGLNGKNYVFDHYSWDQIIKTYIRVFDEFEEIKS